MEPPSQESPGIELTYSPSHYELQEEHNRPPIVNGRRTPCGTAYDRQKVCKLFRPEAPSSKFMVQVHRGGSSLGGSSPGLCEV